VGRSLWLGMRGWFDLFISGGGGRRRRRRRRRRRM